MVEYIEREAAYALSKIICDAIRNREFHPANFGHFILDRIDDIPAADVQPVRHGYDTGKSLYFHCSACDYGVSDVFEDGPTLVFEKGKIWNYCPNCGAKMDEEKE